MVNSLANLTIVITRPIHQARAFQQRLLQAGAKPVLFPVLAVKNHPVLPSLDAVMQTIKTQDWVIFTSQNALHFALQQCPHLAQKLPSQIAAIGAKTAQALIAHHIKPTLIPSKQFTSEELLAAPELQQVKQQQIFIIKGLGGRSLLVQELQQRGASVNEIAVYQRCLATITPQTHCYFEQWQPTDIICITSNEGLHNLQQLLHFPNWLYNLPLLVGSSRIAQQAYHSGFRYLIVANNPSDEAMFDALVDWKQEKQ